MMSLAEPDKDATFGRLSGVAPAERESPKYSLLGRR